MGVLEPAKMRVAWEQARVVGSAIMRIALELLRVAWELLRMVFELVKARGPGVMKKAWELAKIAFEQIKARGPIFMTIAWEYVRARGLAVARLACQLATVALGHVKARGPVVTRLAWELTRTALERVRVVGLIGIKRVRQECEHARLRVGGLRSVQQGWERVKVVASKGLALKGFQLRKALLQIQRHRARQVALCGIISISFVCILVLVGLRSKISSDSSRRSSVYEGRRGDDVPTRTELRNKAERLHYSGLAKSSGGHVKPTSGLMNPTTTLMAGITGLPKSAYASRARYQDLLTATTSKKMRADRYLYEPAQPLDDSSAFPLEGKAKSRKGGEKEKEKKKGKAKAKATTPEVAEKGMWEGVVATKIFVDEVTDADVGQGRAEGEVESQLSLLPLSKLNVNVGSASSSKSALPRSPPLPVAKSTSQSDVVHRKESVEKGSRTWGGWVGSLLGGKRAKQQKKPSPGIETPTGIATASAGEGAGAGGMESSERKTGMETAAMEGDEKSYVEGMRAAMEEGARRRRREAE